MKSWKKCPPYVQLKIICLDTTFGRDKKILNFAHKVISANNLSTYESNHIQVSDVTKIMKAILNQFLLQSFLSFWSITTAALWPIPYGKCNAPKKTGIFVGLYGQHIIEITKVKLCFSNYPYFKCHTFPTKPEERSAIGLLYEVIPYQLKEIS